MAKIITPKELQEIFDQLVDSKQIHVNCFEFDSEYGVEEIFWSDDNDRYICLCEKDPFYSAAPEKIAFDLLQKIKPKLKFKLDEVDYLLSNITLSKETFGDIVFELKTLFD